MDDISNNQADDYKTREQAYIQINRLILDSPTSELMDELRENLPHYLCDSNQSCQRAALNLCESFFKQSDDINYAEFADILYRNCLNTNPDQTCTLLETCLKADYASVSPLLFENIENHTKFEIQSIFGILISYLASLNTRSTRDAEDIIKNVSPLIEKSTNDQIDEDIRNQALSIVNSAKIICGISLSSIKTESNKHGKGNNNSSISTSKSNLIEETWPQQLESENWKERKEGYTQLLSLINDNYPLQNIDRSFLLIAQQEKHIACQNIVLEIVEKIGSTYREKIARKIREYSNIVVSMMSQKKNSRLTNLQAAFDSLALNVTSNPYELPFSEILLKMMTNSNLRLREESLQFIIRVTENPNNNIHFNKSSQVSDQLSKLLSDPSLQIREMASSILNPKTHKEKSNSPQNAQQQNNSVSNSDNNNNQNSNSNPNSSNQNNNNNNNVIQLASNQGCNESIKKAYLRNKKNNLQNQWSHWIDSETLELLSSGQWLSVTKGLEMLQTKYNESDKSIRNALVVCFLAIFTGKTFTPKVMTNIYQNVLYYIRNDKNNDNSKLSDEAVSATVNFCIDKINDKHNENTIFEILDECCTNSGDQFVFDILYPHLSSAKNPAVLFRITSFFSHHLSIEKQNESTNGEFQLKISPDSLFNSIKPLLTHGDQQVRKITNEICNEYLPTFVVSNNNAGNSQNQTEKQSSTSQSASATSGQQQNQIGSHPKNQTNINKQNSSQIPRQQSNSQIPKQPSSISNDNLINNGGTSSSPNADPGQTCLISPKLISMVGKMSSILDCRRGLEEIENVLNSTLTKNGENSVESKEFTDLFAKLRTWFKDSNTNIVFSVSKVVLLSLKLLKDVNFLTIEFLNDLALLLNFVHKGIRQTTLQIFNELFDMMGESFISNVFLSSFSKLNAGGRKTAVLFIKDLLPRIEINIIEFTPFVVSILADKNEEFRNAALPIIQKFMLIDGGIAALKKEADQFPPAKKNMVLEIINGIESDLDIPNNEEFNNSHENTSIENNNVEDQRPTTANQTEANDQNSSGTHKRKEEENKQNQNQNQINETKIPKRCSSSAAKNKNQNQNQNQNNEIQLDNNNNQAQVKSSIQLIKEKNRNESDSKIAIFKPKGNSRLRQQKQQPQPQQQQQQLQVLEPLKKEEDQIENDNDIQDLPNPTREEQTVDPSMIHDNSNDAIKSDDQNKIKNSPFSPFVCSLNDTLVQKIRDPSIYIYQWISDLNSSDLSTVSKAAKMILRNLKSNLSIFTIHFDPLSVSLVCKLHSFLSANPIQDSLIRILISCLEIIILNYNPFPKDYAQQIVYEYLGNSDKCTELGDLFNKMVETQTLSVFVSLLSAISDFNDKSEFALKLFEKCSVRVIQNGNHIDICNSLFLLDKFYDLRNRKSLQDNIFGCHILQVFDSYVNNVVEKYGEVVNSIENLKKFQQNSTIMPMITPFAKNLQGHHRSSSPPKPNSPLQKIRITKPQNF